MNVVISGYTAAGKTTHARMLAESLGFSVVWAAGMLLEQLGIDPAATDESRLWFESHRALAERRKSEKSDAVVDRTLVERLAGEDELVFDSRFLPWLSDVDCVRVWIDSDLGSRARKCFVSLGCNDPSLLDCALHVHDKDMLDIARVARSYGSIFTADTTRFDVVLDNSALMPDPDPQAAQAGIARFHPYLLAAVRAAQGETAGLSALLRDAPTEYGHVVRYVRRVRTHLVDADLH